MLERHLENVNLCCFRHASHVFYEGRPNDTHNQIELKNNGGGNLLHVQIKYENS